MSNEPRSPPDAFGVLPGGAMPSGSSLNQPVFGRALRCAGVALLLAMAIPAQPADVAAVPSGIVPQIEEGKRIYLPSQFLRFAPQTAADIVGQIPGFSVTNVSNNRGLGEASQNVLINSQRITGKGNDAMAVLRRIPVAAVVRMEIVDGAMLDITGLSGHVLNVLTAPDQLQGNFVWRPQIRERIADHWPGGEASVAGKSSLGDFTLGLRWDGFRGGGWGTEVEYRPADDVTVLREREPLFANDMPKLSGSLSGTTAAGSIWNINAGVERRHFRRRTLTRYQEPGEPAVTETSRGDERKWRTEIGSDYEFALGSGRLKLVGYFSERDGPNSNQLTSLVDGELVPTGSRFSRDATEGERVGRAEYRWNRLGADWTVSTELAHNFVNATGKLEQLDENGDYELVPLPGASSRVEEQRGESILGVSRSLGEGWSLQVSGGGEYSRLEQSGENGRTRSFWRPKGSVSVAWNPASLWELNLKLQRQVSQLNFFDFLASVDVANDNTNGSNPTLVPPQSWVAEFQTVRTLGRGGKVTLNLLAEDISDLVAQVPISIPDHVEAPGNLSSARRFEASLKAGLLLDGMGIPGGKLDAYATIRDTRMRDPLTGTHREFNGNRYYWNLDFRHDVPGTNWTWGLFTEVQSTNHSYRLNFEEHFTPANPFTSVFLEHKDILGLKVRATVLNLLRKAEVTRQVAYDGWRNDPVSYTRHYPLEFGMIYRLQVSGTF